MREIPTSEDVPLKVWRELFLRMAKDPKTLDLLRHLHGDLAVEFSAIETAQAKDQDLMMSPLPDGVMVAIRVGDNVLDKTNRGGGGSFPRGA